MAIYVDTLTGCVPNANWRHYESCHLFSDSDDPAELHDFARRIGLERKWFQPDWRLPHYDLTRFKRCVAVTAGAIECRREKVSDEMHRRGFRQVPPDEARRRRLEAMQREAEARRRGYKPAPKPELFG